MNLNHAHFQLRSCWIFWIIYRHICHMHMYIQIYTYIYICICGILSIWSSIPKWRWWQGLKSERQTTVSWRHQSGRSIRSHHVKELGEIKLVPNICIYHQNHWRQTGRPGWRSPQAHHQKEINRKHRCNWKTACHCTLLPYISGCRHNTHKAIVCV